ncbi:TetR/AcrR family transcriptional regulator [Massilia sp. erpn]|uniref:TetR/AcrR family transcriptional regulator n=1 Tax=Massilia sp. erpn TaxID=2738142 RepID=UPI0021041838|nr:TetR/AcrR family transcriptional regulator [Massilia sp. erpn]UTY59508.1 TetR/AcrR family transcriptional regulator [Massilia sp. erpn]
MKQPLPPTPVPARRRPQQSRARQTSLALQHAFVRLLPERGFEALTIREIVDVAGTGLGSFYEYFANKDDLARVSVHLRSKTLLEAMHGAVAAQAGQPLAQLVRAILLALAGAHASHPLEWGAHYALERQVSDPSAYARMYERFVKEWASALTRASDGLVAGPQLEEAARTCHTIAYGLFAHAHIRGYAEGMAADTQAIARQAELALLGYLAQLQAP